MKFEEFKQEQEWWGSEDDGFAFRVENNHAWKVSIEEIIERNFNLDIKNPYQEEVVSHDPQELLASYEQQQQDITDLRNKLKGILGDALKSSVGEGE